VEDTGRQLDADAIADVAAGRERADVTALREAVPASDREQPDRRCFVGRAGRTIAVAAPLILLFRPSAAYAASASSS